MPRDSMTHRNRILEANEVTTSFRISFLANFLVGPVYSRAARSPGVSRSEFVILFCLHHLGSLTAQDVCEITGRPKNSVSQAVQRLLRAGRVRRRTDADDGRRAPLLLTPKGRAACAAVIPLFLEREAQMLSVLDAAEQRQLEALLRKLVLRDDDWAKAF